MTALRNIPMLAVLISMSGSPARAELAFERKFLELRATVEQTQATVQFTFTNAGSGEVAVTVAETNCDCTTASADRPSYKPGEKGVITAIFDFGQRIGAQEKTIKLKTGDPAQPEVVLRFVVHIPEVAEITPRLLLWKAGEKPSAKTIRITIAHDVKMKMIEASSDNPAVRVELVMIEEGKVYDLVVTPTETAKPLTATLAVKSDFPADKPRIFQAFAKILPAEDP